MAIELFKLVGSIMVDNEKANKSIHKTGEDAEKTSSKLMGGVKKAAKWGAGIAAAAGTAVVGMTKMAKSSAHNADEIDKMSQKLGMSAKGYQEWDYVLSQAGVDINSMQTGMKTLTNQIDDAKNGSDKARERFEKLGISMNDLNNMSREDIFSKVVEGMQSMEDSTGRAALANDLFGKSGQNLTPLFNEAAESTENLKNKANELGMVMSDSAVKGGAALNDAFDTMQRSGEGLKNQLGIALFPVVTELINFITSMMPGVKILIDALKPVFVSVFSSLLPPLKDLINQLLPLIAPLLEAMMPVLNLVVKIIQKVIPLIATGLAGAIKIVIPVVAGLAKIVEDVFGSLIGFIKPPINAIIDAVNNVIGSINKMKIPDWVPGVGGKSLNLTKFKKLRVGIDYVPSDDYPAVLHEGEAVLTKQQAYMWRNGMNADNSDVVNAIMKLISEMPALVAEGMAGTGFNINNREFARLVKKNA